MASKNYQVLLYYKYVNLTDPQKVLDEQRKVCEKLKLTGRIIIAAEGINGTVEGTIKNTEKYIAFMQTQKEFADINFKKSESSGKSFPKLSIRVRPEIVSAYMPDLNPLQVTGKYLSAEELYHWYTSGKEFYVVDMRNDYEHVSGYFENSILSGFQNFRDLPTVIQKLKHLKNRTIVTVCTGGVRCEKASGFLVQNGFAKVYQLKDGIQTFMETYPNTFFKGKLYVFDNRITVGFNTNSPDHVIVGVCENCHQKSDHYVNCANLACHRHYISCESCADSKGDHYCVNCTSKSSEFISAI